MLAAARKGPPYVFYFVVRALHKTQSCNLV
jgi:hypothetical protein